MILKQIRWSNE